MTLESQDNKTTGCECWRYDMGYDWHGDWCVKRPKESAVSHSPATNDMVEDAIHEFFELQGHLINTGSPRNFTDVRDWLRSKLNEVISRTREEAYDEGLNDNWGGDRRIQLEQAKEQGASEERERIANIVKNWHYKKGGYTELAHFIESGKSE